MAHLRPSIAALLCGLFVLAAACGDAETPELVEEMGAFRGVVEDGVLVSLEMIPRRSDVVDGTGALEQPLTVVPEDRDGRRGLASVPDVVELTTQGRADLAADGYPVPGPVVDGCGTGVGAFEVFAGIRNFHDAPLTAVHIVIDEITGDALDHTLCNSDAVPKNLLLAGQPLPTGLGLVRYGFLDRDDNGPDALPTGGIIPRPRGADTTSRAVRWRFKNNGSFQFFGRVLGRVCGTDCSPGTSVNEGPIAGTPVPRFVDADGPVLAVVEGSGVAYLGGTFTRVGHRTGAAAIVPADPLVAAVTSGHVPAFEGGVVDTAISDGNGGFYVGGTFTSVGGFDRPRLVHILANGSVDPTFTPPAGVAGSGTISALALDVTDGRLWVGRTAAPHLSVLSSTTGVAALTPVEPGDDVNDILVVGNAVFVAGAFDNYGTVTTRDKLVKLSRTTGVVDGAFATPAFNAGSRVNALASDGTTTLWVGGSFTAPRARAAAVAVGNGALQAWNPNVANGEVFALQQVGAVVYLGGSFTTVRAQTKNRLAAVASTGDANTMRRAWAPNPNGTVVNHLVVSGASVFVAGNFATIAGTPRAGIAAVTSDVTAAGTIRAAWNPAPSRPTGAVVEGRTIALSGTRALIGGDFGLAGATPRAGLAAVNLATGALTTATVAITGGEVRALALGGNGNLYLGGTFTNVGNQGRLGLAAVNAGTFALVTGFNIPIAAGNFDNCTAEVDVLTTSATHLYFGGNFGQANGAVRGRLARATLAGVLDSWHDPTVGPRFMNGGRVRSIALLPDGDVLVGGDFVAVGINILFPPVPARRLARLGALNGQLVFDYNVSAPVHGIAVSADGRTAFAAGNFTSVLGQASSRVAAIDLQGNGLKAGFAAPAFNGVVQAIDLVGPSIVVGGAFTSPQNRFAVLDVEQGADQGVAMLGAGAATGAVRSITDAGAFIVTGIAPGTTDHLVTTAGPATARRTGFAVVNAP